MQHTQYTQRAEMGCGCTKRLSRRQSACQLTEPTQRQPDHEDEDGAPHDLQDGSCGGYEVELTQRHEGGDPHDKHEEGEDQIGGCEAVPLRVA